MATVFFIFLSHCAWSLDTTVQQDTVRIGAFNIQIFGLSKVSKPNVLTVLAQIASTYDVLALEEVGSNASRASDQTCIQVMNDYVARVNKMVGADLFAYVRGNQYAILYRKDRFTVPEFSVYSGTQSFSYTPLTAYLKSTTGNLDFVMVVIHTSPGKAKKEIPALQVAMKEVSAKYSEPDVICLGDFNADGSYFDEGVGSNLEGYSSSSYISVIPNSADTTVSLSSNTYDRIQLSSTMATDYAANWGVLDFGKAFDVSKAEGTANSQGRESAVSDHYPVWGEFWVNRDDD